MTPMEFLIEAAKVYPSEPVWLVRLDFLGWILFSCWRNPSKNLVTLHMCIYVYIYTANKCNFQDANFAVLRR